MFADAGHVMTLFDRFYEPEQQAFDRQYDFIIAAEVVEHLQEPKRELERLWACLKPGGWLGIMTQYAVPKDAFPRWHYKNDLTHVCFFSTATFAWIARALNAELTFAERDVVLFRKKPASPRLLPAQSEERPLTPLLPILYQDDYLVAVNKPSGMLVHRSDIDFHERENAMKILRDRLGRWVYPFHRLDKAASGVLLFALDRETARYMTELFSGGMISKTYLAIVRGFTKERERIDYALKEIGDRMTDGNADRERAPKVAVTEYRRLATVEIPEPVGRYATARYSLLQVMPSTGRKHQIRRHMKHIFHPIAGDTTYGDGRQNAFFRARFQVNRLLLHASAVGFSHPRTGARLDIAAPPDETFRMLLDTLLWNKDVHCDR
jgi:tRNA pseudouridine65 synthase